MYVCERLHREREREKATPSIHPRLYTLMSALICACLPQTLQARLVIYSSRSLLFFYSYIRVYIFAKEEDFFIFFFLVNGSCTKFFVFLFFYANRRDHFGWSSSNETFIILATLSLLSTFAAACSIEISLT